MREGVDPGNLPPGYYRVRRSKHWWVARWMPDARQWEVGGFASGASYQWPAAEWDEIGEKVA
jgi:hypothetical protein